MTLYREIFLAHNSGNFSINVIRECYNFFSHLTILSMRLLIIWTLIAEYQLCTAQKSRSQRCTTMRWKNLLPDYAQPDKISAFNRNVQDFIIRCEWHSSAASRCQRTKGKIAKRKRNFVLTKMLYGVLFFNEDCTQLGRRM